MVAAGKTSTNFKETAASSKGFKMKGKDNDWIPTEAVRAI
jgi:hypothetical protein